MSARAFLFLALAACGPEAFPQDEQSVDFGEVSQTSRTRYDDGSDISVHTTLGIADGATAQPSNANHYLSVKEQYVISYNESRKTPNWVAWELNTSWFGSASRARDFTTDDTLPDSIDQAQPSDYSGSGYTRGHMCPSADRTRSRADNDGTFILTNIVPQGSVNNGGPWEKLESYSRGLATRGKQLFIVSGGVYQGPSKTIGASGVHVPTATFKVIVVLEHPGDGVESVTTSTRVIAIMVPNENRDVEQNDPWTKYVVTIRDIERATGFDFNALVPSDIQDVIENTRDADDGPL